MDKPSTVSKTYRVTMIADEHRAFKVWCAMNDVLASEFIAKAIRRKIDTNQLSPLRVGEMCENENTCV
jgi:hypothetical protein